MDEMTCPQCQEVMRTHQLGDLQVARCTGCSGVFLDRAELGILSEAESDWHRSAATPTEPVPRITAGMDAPPPGRPRARSFVETLFG